MRGPSSPSTTVFDHQNGTYEVVFLIIEPGIYTVHAYLEHSLCDGLKEPPDNWFVIGEFYQFDCIKSQTLQKLNYIIVMQTK